MSSNVKILIGDESSDFGKVLFGALNDTGYSSVICPSDGSAVIEKIRTDSPDIVICDALMSNINAVEIIRLVNDSDGRKPFFIVLSPYRNTYIEKEILSFSNAYLLLKPVDSETIISVIGHVIPSSSSETNANDGAHMEMIVTDIIHQIGIPAHIKGYHYLREAILLAINDQDMLESVTKMLYPAVAGRFDTSPSRVERAIRHAIETAWDRGDVDTLNNMFGYTINGGKGKPTNSEFIALITDNLRLKFKLSSVRSCKSSAPV